MNKVNILHYFDNEVWGTMDYNLFMESIKDLLKLMSHFEYNFAEYVNSIVGELNADIEDYNKEIEGMSDFSKSEYISYEDISTFTDGFCAEYYDPVFIYDAEEESGLYTYDYSFVHGNNEHDPDSNAVVMDIFMDNFYNLLVEWVVKYNLDFVSNNPIHTVADMLYSFYSLYEDQELWIFCFAYNPHEDDLIFAVDYTSKYEFLWHDPLPSSYFDDILPDAKEGYIIKKAVIMKYVIPKKIHYPTQNTP